MRDLRPYIAVGIAACVAVLGAAYYFFDPSESAWMPKCLWKTATGTDCPGCGSQRMAHSLLHGDIAAAWEANAFALCMLPLIGFMLWLEFSRKSHPGLYRKVHAPWVVWMFLSLIVAWWIVRNFL